MWQSPSEGQCGYYLPLPCTWGEENSGSILRAGLTGWKEARLLTCHPKSQHVLGFWSAKILAHLWVCCCHPAKTQQHKALSLPELPPSMLASSLILPICSENKQHLMIDLGSTWQEGTKAASRYSSSCWDHLAFSTARRATFLLPQGPVYVWLPGWGRSQSSTPLRHSNVF